MCALPLEVTDMFLKGQRGVGAAPAIATTAAVALPARPVSDVQNRLPAKLWASLLPFQREGVEYAVSRGGRALIADEMGLGKSLQALAGSANCTVCHARCCHAVCDVVTLYAILSRCMRCCHSVCDAVTLYVMLSAVLQLLRTTSRTGRCSW